MCSYQAITPGGPVAVLGPPAAQGQAGGGLGEDPAEGDLLLRLPPAEVPPQDGHAEQQLVEIFTESANRVRFRQLSYIILDMDNHLGLSFSSIIDNYLRLS